jgi:uncharacterized protein (TIGR00251 family)
MPEALPWNGSARGLLVAVRLTPMGGRDAIEGTARLANGSQVVKVRVRAAPHEGAANAALVTVMAKALGVPPSRVSLVSGQTARVKTVSIEGASADLAARLAQAIGKVAA